LGTGVAAEAIETACLKAARPGTTRSLCTCIQSAADATLTVRDQRLAASFFSDPAKAQSIRQSDSRSHEKFWTRYKEFNTKARSYCSARS
jgi:hypothetical protein